MAFLAEEVVPLLTVSTKTFCLTASLRRLSRSPWLNSSSPSASFSTSPFFADAVASTSSSIQQFLRGPGRSLEFAPRDDFLQFLFARLSFTIFSRFKTPITKFSLTKLRRSLDWESPVVGKERLAEVRTADGPTSFFTADATFSSFASCASHASKISPYNTASFPRQTATSFSHR